MNLRIGFGFDVHQLEEGLDFALGGIIVPHTKGGVGHSDADVLIHSICDALLGAANLGDIGSNFPDTDPKYADIDSKVLLSSVMNSVRDKGYDLINFFYCKIIFNRNWEMRIIEMFYCRVKFFIGNQLFIITKFKCGSHTQNHCLSMI